VSFFCNNSSRQLQNAIVLRGLQGRPELQDHPELLARMGRGAPKESMGQRDQWDRRGPSDRRGLLVRRVSSENPENPEHLAGKESQARWYVQSL
jgi:hypothetical protein